MNFTCASDILTLLNVYVLLIKTFIKTVRNNGEIKSICIYNFTSILEVYKIKPCAYAILICIHYS